MYRPAYGPPIRGFMFPETSVAQFMFFLKKTQRSVLFLYIGIGTPGPTYVSLLTILYIFILFYMLLYYYYYYHHHIFNRYLHMSENNIPHLVNL